MQVCTAVQACILNEIREGARSAVRSSKNRFYGCSLFPRNSFLLPFTFISSSRLSCPATFCFSLLALSTNLIATSAVHTPRHYPHVLLRRRIFFKCKKKRFTSKGSLKSLTASSVSILCGCIDVILDTVQGR